jgi:hypothetical protein
MYQTASLKEQTAPKSTTEEVRFLLTKMGGNPATSSDVRLTQTSTCSAVSQRVYCVYRLFWLRSRFVNCAKEDSANGK